MQPRNPSGGLPARDEGLGNSCKVAQSKLRFRVEENGGDGKGPFTILEWRHKEDPDIPCCHSDAEALNRLASMLTSLFARGYPVPLLYRMKHYSFAAAFVRLGCMTHRLLPRILQEMNSTMSQDTPGSHLSEFIDALLEGSGVTKTDAEIETLLSSFLNEDVNYAAQNGARQKMVLRELSNRQFHQSSIMIDMMVQRMETGINFFLRRTKVLYDLQYMSHAHPKHASLRQETKTSFLKVISGEFGWDLIAEYMSILHGHMKETVTMGLDGSQSQLNLIFQLTIVLLTDLSRRFVLEFMGPPYSLLKLACSDASSFVSGWNHLQHSFSKCRRCVDYGFTTALLEAYPGKLSMPLSQDAQSAVSELKSFPQELCVWSLTSDAVEILHGQMQWQLSRRGAQQVKQGRTALEVSVLANSIKKNSWIAESVRKLTMPSKKLWAGIRRFCGTRSSNQYTSRDEVA